MPKHILCVSENYFQNIFRVKYSGKLVPEGTVRILEGLF